MLTVNSDDPAMFGVDLATEYSTMHHVMGFSARELATMALNGIEAAWVDDATKKDWRATWTADIERILADVEAT